MGDQNIVGDWLRSLHLGQYAESFLDNGYDDLEICKQIGEPDLDAIGVTHAAHRMLILQAVATLLQQGGTAVYFTLEESAGQELTDAPVAEVTSAGGGGTRPTLLGSAGASITHVPPRKVPKAKDKEPLPLCLTGYEHDLLYGGGPFQAPLLGARKYLDEYEEGKAELGRYPRIQLKALVRDRLARDGIRLSAQPYSNPDGSRGRLETLAARYAEELRTHYRDVLERLEELRRRRVAIDFPPLPQHADNLCLKQTQTYKPGKYSPSSCLRDQEDESIYSLYQDPSLSASRHPLDRCLSPRSRFLYEPCHLCPRDGKSTTRPSPSEQGKKRAGLGRLFRSLGTRKDRDKMSPRHGQKGRLQSKGEGEAQSPQGEVLLGEDEQLQLMLLVRDGFMNMEQAIQRIRQREALKNKTVGTPDRSEVLADLGKGVWSPTGSKKHQQRNVPVLYSASQTTVASKHIYYEPPEDLLDWSPEVAPTGERGNLHSRDTCSVCSGPPECRTHFLDPQSENPLHQEGPSEAYTQEEFTSAILARTQTRAAAEASPPVPHRAATNPPAPCGSTEVTSSIPDTEGAQGMESLLATNEKRCSAASCCSSCSREGGSDCSAPTAHRCQEGTECCGHCPTRDSLDSSKADGGEDYASSPVSERRSKSSVLGRLKNFASRTSYSTSEDGHSHSSDYEEQEEIDRKMEPKSPRDSAGRSSSTWTGRMRDLHRDVKRRISRLRNSRGTPSDAEPRGDGSEQQDVVIQPGSSVESIPSGSGSSLQPPTPTSSNRSSTSAGEDDSAPFVGAIVGRARALVDYTPSPYDRDGLAFKKGDIIDIIAKPKSGTWVGMVHGRVGHFKFINVEELTEETKPRHRRHRIPPDWSLLPTKPETLEDLLKQLELQEYTNVLVLNGYEDLDTFKEIEPEDLDSLRIVNPEHRMKLLRAAEVLLGCEDIEDVALRHNSPRDSGCYASHENLAQREASQRVVQNGQVSGDAEDPDISQSESGIQSSEGPDSNTTINNLDITTSSCSKSLLPAEGVAMTSEGLEDTQEVKYNISATAEPLLPSDTQPSNITEVECVAPSNGIMCNDFLRRSSESLTRSSHLNQDSMLTQRTYSDHYTDRRQELVKDRVVVNGSSHPYKKGKGKKSREKHDDRGGSPSRSGHDSSSPCVSLLSRSPDIHACVYSWTSPDRKTTPSKKKVQEYEDVESTTRSDTSPGKKHLKKAKQRKGSLQPLNRNPRPPSPVLLDAVAEKLDRERIDLCREPYTDKTGFCGIPPALVQRYAEELQRDICDVADALDQTRIDLLQQIGRRGIPNDFLGESCQVPVVEANYSSLSSWLASLGLPMYEDMLTSEGYSELSHLATMTADDLRKCGIEDQRHLRFIHTAIGVLHARFGGFQLCQ